MSPHRQSGGPCTARCVVVQPRAGMGVEAAPPELIASLERRGVETIRATGVYGAMAELCLAARAGAATPALVVVEPARIEGVERLVSAAGRYAPGAPIWRYDAGGEPRLRSYFAGAQPSKEAGDPGVVRVVTRPVGPPALRLTPTPPVKGPEGSATETKPTKAAPAPVTLTEEELAMLLADDWEHPPGPNGPGGGGSRA